MDWIFVSPQNLCVEILISSVMVLGDGVFGRWLFHEEGALVNGISAPKKETLESCLIHPLCHMKTQWEAGSYHTPNLPVPWSQIPHPPELWEVHVCSLAILSVVF